MKFPLTLDILPGQRWSGKLTVIGREPAGFTVAFNATIVSTGTFVYDRAVLSEKQVRDWTGWVAP